MDTARPLDGLKIIDFSAVFAGPLCTRYLLDCGADVVKVETPGVGDHTRGVDGMSRVFAHFNAGKRSIAIDLKQAEGQALARQLLAGADVLIENFRPGVMGRFNLDYDSLSIDHPRLIYCSISGFGQTGPWVNRAAYAPIVHAASGFDTVFGTSQDHSERPPNWEIMMADIVTGTLAYGAIQTALLGRIKNGRGEHLDISMMEAVMTLIPAHIQNAQMPSPAPIGRYCPVRTADGFVMLSIVSDKNLHCLAKALRRPELLDDPRFVRGPRTSNIKALMTEIETWSQSLSASECEERLNAAGVPCSRYQQVDELFDHPQVVERQSFSPVSEELLGEFLIQNLPVKFRHRNSAASPSVAKLGEHTDVILSEHLRLSPEEIAVLRDKGVVS